jgi:hypothetical protein
MKSAFVFVLLLAHHCLPLPPRATRPSVAEQNYAMMIREIRTGNLILTSSGWLAANVIRGWESALAGPDLMTIGDNRS